MTAASMKPDRFSPCVASCTGTHRGHLCSRTRTPAPRRAGGSRWMYVSSVFTCTTRRPADEASTCR
eukprot:12862156-Alexandrium_andersonii.AAC.1